MILPVLIIKILPIPQYKYIAFISLIALTLIIISINYHMEDIKAKSSSTVSERA